MLAHYVEQKHICSTTVSIKQYFHEQIKKAPWEPEDIFIQMVQIEPIRLPAPSCATGNSMEVTPLKDSVDREG